MIPPLSPQEWSDLNCPHVELSMMICFELWGLKHYHSKSISKKNISLRKGFKIKSTPILFSEFEFVLLSLYMSSLTSKSGLFFSNPLIASRYFSGIGWKIHRKCRIRGTLVVSSRLSAKLFAKM